MHHISVTSFCVFWVMWVVKKSKELFFVIKYNSCITWWLTCKIWETLVINTSPCLQPHHLANIFIQSHFLHVVPGCSLSVPSHYLCLRKKKPRNMLMCFHCIDDSECWKDEVCSTSTDSMWPLVVFISAMLCNCILRTEAWKLNETVAVSFCRTAQFQIVVYLKLWLQNTAGIFSKHFRFMRRCLCKLVEIVTELISCNFWSHYYVHAPHIFR